VEKLTGMKMLDFMREEILNELGFSKEAYMIPDPVGISQGGSGMMCTLRDMACYAIMTIMELNTPKTTQEQTKNCLVDITMDDGWLCIEDFAHAFTRGKWYPKTSNNVIKGDDGVDYVATQDITKKFIQTPIK
jgi:CubicO group peptidase (beta-lactamase class C family)